MAKRLHGQCGGSPTEPWCKVAAVNAAYDVTADPIRYIDWYESPVGPLLVSATESAVCGLSFCSAGDLPRRLQMLRERHRGSLRSEGDSPLDTLREQLQEYFRGQRREFTLPLKSAGSEFQQRVWAALIEIPYGQTISYGELAARIGRKSASRAVGLANGSNPLPIVIPCHRVIGANGKLTGYGGGLAIKEWVAFMSARNLVICFEFRSSLQRAIKLMNAVLVRRSAELAYRSRRG